MAPAEEQDDKKNAERSAGEDEEAEKKESQAAEHVAVQEGKEEAEGAEEDIEAEGAEENEGKGKKKRGRKPKEDSAEKKVTKRKLDREAKPTVERPTRERKTVERFSVMSPQSASATKVVSIQQGSGTKLKDIPNVFYKLSKRKADESLQLLHTILYGKKTKAWSVKRNICQFSGFVWSEDEEKKKTKVKEKLDKLVKDKLLDFCDILDVPVSRATTKKEDLSAKLLEFLESPRATRDVILADKEKKKKKQKSKRKSGGESERGEKKRASPQQEKDDSEEKGGDASDDEAPEEQEEKSDTESGEGEQEDEQKPTGKDTSRKKTQSGSSVSGKGRTSAKNKEPTKEKLHAVVRDILKEVDFNTATLADILKQLGTRFRMDLMHRKAEVKGIIEEVINDMTDDEDDGQE